MSEALNTKEHMHSLFRYIESNISADLDTELLSSVGYVSRDKLYHDFYSISGHSVKEYIRKRRLSNALALIKASDMGLTDIAFRVRVFITSSVVPGDQTKTWLNAQPNIKTGIYIISSRRGAANLCNQ